MFKDSDHLSAVAGKSTKAYVIVATLHYTYKTIRMVSILGALKFGVEPEKIQSILSLFS